MDELKTGDVVWFDKNSLVIVTDPSIGDCDFTGDCVQGFFFDFFSDWDESNYEFKRFSKSRGFCVGNNRLLLLLYGVEL